MGKNNILSIKFGEWEEIELNESSPTIKKVYWVDAKGEKIINANLEETVYFLIETKGFEDGTKIKLKLRESDAPLWPDKKFDGEEIVKEAVIKDNMCRVELYLPDSWASMIAEDVGDSIELYWEASIERELSLFGLSFSYEKINNLCYNFLEYLYVYYSKRELYIKPSQILETFPEIYSSTGEQIVVLVNMAASEAIENAKSSIETGAEVYAQTSLKNAAHNYAIGKIEQGYMVTTEGVEYYLTRDSGKMRKLKDVQFISKDGKYIETKQGYDFFTRTKEGKVITTMGVDQYQYHYDQQYGKELANSEMYYNQKAGCKVKVLGALNKVSTVMDVFSVFQYAANPTHDEPLPIPIPGTDVIGMIAYDKFNEFEDCYKTALENHQRKLLDETKLKGIDAIRRLIYNNNAGYELLDISPEIGSRIIHGEFNNIYEIIDANLDETESNRNITMLYRQTKHPISNLNITIIETFFINE